MKAITQVGKVRKCWFYRYFNCHNEKEWQVKERISPIKKNADELCTYLKYQCPYQVISNSKIKLIMMDCNLKNARHLQVINVIIETLFDINTRPVIIYFLVQFSTIDMCGQVITEYDNILIDMIEVYSHISKVSGIKKRHMFDIT